jgi:hypothetical protein
MLPVFAVSLFRMLQSATARHVEVAVHNESIHYETNNVVLPFGICMGEEVVSSASKKINVGALPRAALAPSVNLVPLLSRLGQALTHHLP